MPIGSSSTVYLQARDPHTDRRFRRILRRGRGKMLYFETEREDAEAEAGGGPLVPSQFVDGGSGHRLFRRLVDRQLYEDQAREHQVVSAFLAKDREVWR